MLPLMTRGDKDSALASVILFGSISTFSTCFILKFDRKKQDNGETRIKAERRSAGQIKSSKARLQLRLERIKHLLINLCRLIKRCVFVSGCLTSRRGSKQGGSILPADKIKKSRGPLQEGTRDAL